MEKRKNWNSWFMLGMLPKQNMTSAELVQAKKGEGIHCAPTELYALGLQEMIAELEHLQNIDGVNGEGTPIFVATIGMVRMHQGTARRHTREQPCYQ